MFTCLAPPGVQVISKYVTRSDKRVARCQFGHSELLIPTESATEELEFVISYKTALNVQVSEVMA